MSEWSDEAVKAAFDALWLRTPSDGVITYSVVKRMLDAVDAVRKREAEQRATVNTPEFMDPLEALERRVAALEAARPAETSGYAHELATQEVPAKPTPERRCGTCRWYEPWTPDTNYVGRCWWERDHMPTPIGQRHIETKPEMGTDCPTWEARP